MRWPHRVAVVLPILGALVACGGSVGSLETPPADAGNPTQIKIVTDWSGKGEGYRVVEVPVKNGITRICVERLVKYGGGWNDDPHGSSVSISCESGGR